MSKLFKDVPNRQVLKVVRKISAYPEEESSVMTLIGIVAITTAVVESLEFFVFWSP